MQDRTDAGTLDFGMSCRGIGKIYTRIRTADERIARWEATSRTKRGVEVPASVATLEGYGHVLVLVVLTRTQWVTVRALDADGTVLYEGTRVVQPKAAQALSIVNDVVRGDVVDDVRRLDTYVRDALGVFFDVDRLIHDEEDMRILHLSFTIRCRDESQTKEVVHIRALDINGQEAPAQALVTIGDRVMGYPTVTSALERTLNVSLRIPPHQAGVILWLRFEDGSREDAFFEVPPNQLRDLGIMGVSTQMPVELAGNYEEWLYAQRLDESALRVQRERQKGFAIRPLFSVVIPLYHTPVNYLREAADSMLQQSYPNLELILVNSTPQDTDLTACVQAYANNDPRVKVVTLEENLGITENTNAGIAVATGDYVSFMDHDDIAELDLFYSYVEGINEHPDTDLLYCDEDLLEEGRYYNAFFKPDWSMPFLETNNYVCHLLTVRRALLAEVPTPTREVDGAQDHSLSLAVGERARNVFHARKVLYHWRSHPLSTAKNADAKPESLEAGKLGIERHFERMGIDATCKPRMDWLHVYAIDLTATDLPSATVVLWGDGPTQPSLLASLEHTLHEPNLVEVARDAGQTWSQAVGMALAGLSDGLVVVVSKDAKVTQDSWLTRLVPYALRTDVGIATPRMLYADGTIASLGVACSGKTGILKIGRFLPKNTGFGRGVAQLPHTVLAADPRCFVIRATLLNELGGWDSTLGMDAACVDLSVRARKAGVPVCAVCTSELVVSLEASEMTHGIAYGISHKVTDADTLRIREYAELVRRWPQLAGADPYYHAALSLDGKYGFEGAWRWHIPMNIRESIKFKLSY